MGCCAPSSFSPLTTEAEIKHDAEVVVVVPKVEHPDITGLLFPIVVQSTPGKLVCWESPSRQHEYARSNKIAMDKRLAKMPALSSTSVTTAKWDDLCYPYATYDEKAGIFEFYVDKNEFHRHAVKDQKEVDELHQRYRDEVFSPLYRAPATKEGRRLWAAWTADFFGLDKLTTNLIYCVKCNYIVDFDKPCRHLAPRLQTFLCTECGLLEERCVDFQANKSQQ